MATIFFARRLSQSLAAALLCALLAACGGGGGDATPTLTLTAQTTQALVGGNSVTITANKNLLSGVVSWSLADRSPGTLDARRGDANQYIPTDAGSNNTDNTVTITASVAGRTQSIAIVLKPAPA